MQVKCVGMTPRENSAGQEHPVLRLVKSATVFLLVCLVFSQGVLAASSVNVPLDHWSYRAIDKLDGFGLIQSDLQGTRPFTRLEVARLVNEAIVRKGLIAGEIPPLADRLIDKLKREFGEEMAATEPGAQVAVRSSIKPIDEVQARYVYVEGEPRRILNTGRDLPPELSQYPLSGQGIDATEGTPMVYNNDGVIYGEHHNFTLQVSSRLQYRSFFSAYLQPIFLARENDGDLEDVEEFDLELLRGYAKLSAWNVELQAGRDSLWWGQARSGDLLLTNNAPPLDMLKLSNPTPTLLPWIFRYLGPFKYSAFVSTLDDHLVSTDSQGRQVTDVSFAGYRINFKPHPLLELGWATTFMFGGDGRPTPSFGDFLDAIGFQGLGNANRDFNQLGLIDMRLQLPFLRNAELYAEYGGEDTGSDDNAEEILLGDVGYLVGLYFPMVTCDGLTDLRVEFARNAHRLDQTPGFWYGHSLYRSGYTNDRFIMGHHMAGDALDLFTRVTRYLRDDLLVGVDYEYTKRGIKLNPDTDEIVQGIGLDATYDLNDCMTLMARYGYQDVDNFNLLDGEDRENHLLMTVFKYQF